MLRVFMMRNLNTNPKSSIFNADEYFMMCLF
jgi:hypothetical protein